MISIRDLHFQYYDSDFALSQVTARLAELGIAVAVFAPMGNRSGEGEFDEGMAANIAALAAAVNRP